MKTRTTLPFYSVGEEIANSVTHGGGIVLSVAGLAVLTAFASVFGTAWHIVSCSIYGVTQILLYTPENALRIATAPIRPTVEIAAPPYPGALQLLQFPVQGLFFNCSWLYIITKPNLRYR